VDLISVRFKVSEMFDNVVDSMPDELATLIKEKTFIAGGVFKSLVLDEPVNDWDFWFRDEASRSKFVHLLDVKAQTKSTSITNRDNLKFGKMMKTSENAITFHFPKDKIQFVLTEVGTPNTLIDKFDFCHTQAFYDSITGELHCPTHFMIGKQLNYNRKYKLPLQALKRAFKFTKQGWTMGDEQINEITKAIVGVNWANDEVRKKQTKKWYDETASIRLPQSNDIEDDDFPMPYATGVTTYTTPTPAAGLSRATSGAFEQATGYVTTQTFPTGTAIFGY
jgi:hypothetical protein